jgi:hypothetical protein
LGVWKDSLIARLGLEAGDEKLLEPHAREFHTTAKAMMARPMMEPEGIEGDD